MPLYLFRDPVLYLMDKGQMYVSRFIRAQTTFSYTATGHGFHQQRGISNVGTVIANTSGGLIERGIPPRLNQRSFQ